MSQAAEQIIHVNGLNKSFLGIKALDNIQFDLYPGEVHALMGENGAGKSTFMKILMGLMVPDSGTINFNGELIENMDVHTMLQKGISMIHQEILMVPELTVAQNIFLGREIKQGYWVNEQQINQRSQDLLNLIGLDLDVRTKAKNLSIAELQLIEIAKAISNHAKVIIMDEPTSALSDKESAMLFEIIKDLKSKGVAIIYISHKLEEIFQIADRITVLRDGKFIITKNTNELNKNSLISLMVGREIKNLFSADSRVPGEVILKVQGLAKKGKFSDINFEVHAREVLGIAGLMGAGRTEIARAIFGLDKTDSGEIILKGKKIEIRTPKDAIEIGIGYVSEDRKSLGFIPELSVIENISLSSLRNYSKGWFIQTKNETKASSQMAGDLKIKAASLKQKVINLSGGNQQKVVIAKVLLASPSLIILDEPTRGIDIGAKHEIYKLINQLANNGLAVIIISSELPEILGMSDRILVLSKGKQTAILTKQEATQEKIMHYAVH
ncbi:inositol transport system ATP-binding protein [Daejeonella rubra]|uniref:Inositol transport system ATP-binding protein n=1 Tax=Daejeonella rubra TaxID=990371 RepID=A0A1G9WPR3_9SPHI|nr:sugar ABC transporter ATP-binding protein [Daejeonella rubra]SDM86095.1 inositol transport system ATP-binding protein [Daejeonella rubra]